MVEVDRSTGEHAYPWRRACFSFLQEIHPLFVISLIDLHRICMFQTYNIIGTQKVDNTGYPTFKVKLHKKSLPCELRNRDGLPEGS